MRVVEAIYQSADAQQLIALAPFLDKRLAEPSAGDSPAGPWNAEDSQNHVARWKSSLISAGGKDIA